MDDDVPTVLEMCCKPYVEVAAELNPFDSPLDAVEPAPATRTRRS